MKSNSIIKFALDIGNHSIKLLAGEMNSECDKISIIDYVKMNSRGIKKSKIEDPEELYGSLKECIDKLSERLQYQIEKVSISVGGSGVNSTTRNIKISFAEKEITEDEINELIEQAKKKIFGAKLDGYYRILYKEIYNIRVNNGGIVRQAIGMVGKEIQADIHIVYIEEAYVEKFIELINKAGIEVDEIYLSSYMSSKGTLDEESKKMGVAHVDIGYGTTDIILLKNHKVLYTKSIAIGEMHYISDMSHMLNISKEDAIEILDKFKRKEIENDNTIKYGLKKVSLRDIRDIIQPRTGDIINFITSTIEESGFNGYLAKGIILTGGAVSITGISEQIGAKSGYLARKEKPIVLKGLKQNFYSDAVVIGIFLEDMEKEYRKYMEEKNNIITNKTKDEVPTYDVDKDIEDKKRIDDIDEILEENKNKKGIWQKIKDFF